MAQPIYLDYQATTPLDPAVREAMLPWLGEWFGNPHSEHRYGWQADAAVQAARAEVARRIGAAAQDVVFTSGATESSNLALKGVLTAPGQKRRRIVTFATEHSCVLESARWLASVGAELTLLGVDSDGRADLDALERALGDDVALVAAMAVNNEIGVVHPIGAIAALARRVGALTYCDAAQGFGKVPLDVQSLGVDLLGISGHKIYGPKGIGALWVRSGVRLAPLLHGGGQEGGGLRSGTLSPALCVGLGTAARIAGERMTTDAADAERLWTRARAHLGAVPHVINGSTEHRWRGNLNISFPGVDGSRLLADVLRQVALSSGAACAAAQGKASHVLEALGVPPALAKASLRIGWGRFTSEADIDRGCEAIVAAVRAQGV